MRLRCCIRNVVFLLIAVSRLLRLGHHSPVGHYMLDFFRPQSGSIKDDVLSGLTVALALVP